MHQLPNDILNLMDKLFYFCLKNDVSDLHFESQSAAYRLRYRRHGKLQEYQDIPSDWLMRVMQRIKVLAKLDILNTHSPQDGQWIWRDSHQVQSIPCRLSFCPMYYGEKLVIRLLYPYRQYQHWYELGLNRHQIKHIQIELNQQQGLILVNGPTGSGKTTSLYHFIDYLNDGSRNVVSIEDPIEIPNPHINQIQANPKRGFGLAETLRYVLRQDPDIILIGEIRDEQTAKLAIQAAHTGHLVLASLHAPHAKASFERLKQLGINQADIDHEIRLIIAQRLIPIYSPDGDVLKRQAIFELMNAKGEYLGETLETQKNAIQFQ